MRAPKAVRVAFTAAAAAALAFVTVDARAEATTLTVRRASGAYRVEGGFDVASSPAVAWAVLTDYANLPSFVTSMRSSTAARDPRGRLLVSQQATARVGPLSRDLTLVLDVVEAPPRLISFRDVDGTSFEHYVGTWEIEERAGALTVRYLLVAKPRSSPPLFARSILASNARGLLDQVRAEIERRAKAGQDQTGEPAVR